MAVYPKIVECLSGREIEFGVLRGRGVIGVELDITRLRRHLVSLIRSQLVMPSHIEYKLDQIRHCLSASIPISLLGGVSRSKWLA